MHGTTPSRGTILCIEDNEDTLACFPFLFPDHTVEGAITGAAGIEIAHALHVDLYILDYRLPDMTGTEICRAIRAFDSETPVLVYSGNDVEREVLAAGANAFLLKGADPLKLQHLACALTRPPVPADACASRPAISTFGIAAIA